MEKRKIGGCKDCNTCGQAIYVGEGDTMCSCSNELILVDWIATENFKHKCNEWESK